MYIYVYRFISVICKNDMIYIKNLTNYLYNTLIKGPAGSKNKD